MRSISSFLLMEDIFDNLPEEDNVITSVARKVLNPKVQVVSSDCGTKLGDVIPISYDVIGGIDTLTGQVITYSYVSSLLTAGRGKMSTREYGCILHEGICQKCYTASLPNRPSASVGDIVYFPSTSTVFLKELSNPREEEILTIDMLSELPLEHILVTGDAGYLAGTYNESTKIFTLSSPYYGKTLTVKGYITSTKPYLKYLSDSYSGSVLGLKALPSNKLPIRISMLERHLPEPILEHCLDFLKTSLGKRLSAEISDYIPTVKDKLERFLLILILYLVYYNVA